MGFSLSSPAGEKKREKPLLQKSPYSPSKAIDTGYALAAMEISNKPRGGTKSGFYIYTRESLKEETTVGEYSIAYMGVIKKRTKTKGSNEDASFDEGYSTTLSPSGFANKLDIGFKVERATTSELYADFIGTISFNSPIFDIGINMLDGIYTVPRDVGYISFDTRMEIPTGFNELWFGFFQFSALFPQANIITETGYNIMGVPTYSPTVTFSGGIYPTNFTSDEVEELTFFYDVEEFATNDDWITPASYSLPDYD